MRRPRRAKAPGHALRLALAPLVCALAACASSGWQGAYESRADRPAVEQAELLLVAGADPAAAAAKAEEVLAHDDRALPAETVARAFFALVVASDALGDFERPLPHFARALDRAAGPDGDPSVAARIAAEAGVRGRGSMVATRARSTSPMRCGGSPSTPGRRGRRRARGRCASSCRPSAWRVGYTRRGSRLSAPASSCAGACRPRGARRRCSTSSRRSGPRRAPSPRARRPVRAGISCRCRRPTRPSPTAR